MVAELRLISMNQFQMLVQARQNQNQQHQQNIHTGSWMWYPKVKLQEPDDESWEVRAFAEDTGNAMGTTWPPRSYTCTFCQREFRSAQALGGHMNVHRRDKARLHQDVPGGTNSLSNPPSTLLITTQEFATNGGLCLLYQLHNPNEVFTSSPPMNARSISPYPTLNLMAAAATSINIPVPPPASNSTSPSTTTPADHNILNREKIYIIGSNRKETPIEELDLELRLGHIHPTTS